MVTTTSIYNGDNHHVFVDYYVEYSGYPNKCMVIFYKGLAMYGSIFNFVQYLM